MHPPGFILPLPKFAEEMRGQSIDTMLHQAAVKAGRRILADERRKLEDQIASDKYYRKAFVIPALLYR